jgi:hypothetical protein
VPVREVGERIAVKITDRLGEELLIVHEVTGVSASEGASRPPRRRKRRRRRRTNKWDPRMECTACNKRASLISSLRDTY